MNRIFSHIITALFSGLLVALMVRYFALESVAFSSNLAERVKGQVIAELEQSNSLNSNSSKSKEEIAQISARLAMHIKHDPGESSPISSSEFTALRLRVDAIEAKLVPSSDSTSVEIASMLDSAVAKVENKRRKSANGLEIELMTCNEDSVQVVCKLLVENSSEVTKGLYIQNSSTLSFSDGEFSKVIYGSIGLGSKNRQGRELSAGDIAKLDLAFNKIADNPRRLKLLFSENKRGHELIFDLSM